eukprot:s128_g15.t1
MPQILKTQTHSYCAKSLTLLQSPKMFQWLWDERRNRTRERRKPTDEAIRMHESISPERWCVTYKDLRYLWQEVAEAIHQGEIVPDESASETSEAIAEFGPSIYTVNEQYIKPITAAAGKMSWALMMHPLGLDCDLFVSHAWQEGIFEFLSKLSACWPYSARNAWCCMLANPQNLNIGSMLQCPRTSPFALALQASRHMLVVPNHCKSLYTRLWCGYEAHVASEQGKVVQLATPPRIHYIYRSLLIATGPILLGLSIGILLCYYQVDLRRELVILECCAAVVSVTTSNTLCQVANHFGLLVAACLISLWLSLKPTTCPDPESTRACFLYSAIFQADLVWLCATLMFFLIAELDRKKGIDLLKAAQQLSAGYQGSIYFASCSDETDMEHIWAEIDDKVQEVDSSINVLMSAGMSSPALRNVAAAGVNIEYAGHVEYALPSVFLGPQLVFCLAEVVEVIARHQHTATSWLFVLLEIVGAAARILFLWLLLTSPPDQRCFMLKVITKLVTLIYLPFALAVVIAFGEASTLVFIGFHDSFFAALFFALLGIERTLALPFGKRLLQLFLSRDSGTLGPPTP